VYEIILSKFGEKVAWKKACFEAEIYPNLKLLNFKEL